MASDGRFVQKRTGNLTTFSGLCFPFVAGKQSPVFHQVFRQHNGDRECTTMNVGEATCNFASALFGILANPFVKRLDRLFGSMVLCSSASGKKKDPYDQILCSGFGAPIVQVSKSQREECDSGP